MNRIGGVCELDPCQKGIAKIHVGVFILPERTEKTIKKFTRLYKVLLLCLLSKGCEELEVKKVQYNTRG
jgi:hypothetical protein